ncbi:hypothetical protein M406DRAFT_88894 [Cryphonectria parasitica EP155]|uniref:C3H1-type domain-containing protein n=1 Tax=Cryphonectria parasitica (strain ATCC 38755 / EP155) TaxID=660469 RepID=A0A9P5CQ48_CRYP1|nr:uncharacterized protein M406DRAFT_88894 [Cryphonectria parasitica EP155]KAF3766097.1 hypothetical protein M406DRAFT_88894 [Cryphonectria parasitica EP155]
MDREIMEANGGPYYDFATRFQQMQIQRDAHDKLIKDLLIYSERTETALRAENELLREQIRDANLDLADATKSRRVFQQQVDELQRSIDYMSTANDHLKNYNPYVVVLIDGDGCHFQKQYIERGMEGGKHAAYTLRNAILRECHDQTGQFEVITRFIANLSGLAMITRASGTVESETTFKDFTLGFTQGMASFDFIDVGPGKERTDTKIKEAIRWHLRNHNCKQIVLAISHDSGYASFLDEIIRDTETRQRVTILEGVPTHRDLRATNLNILNLNKELFRAEKLVDRRLSDPTLSPMASPAVVAGMTPLPPPSATTVSRKHSIPSSYATAIKSATPPPQITLPFPPKQTKAAVVRREKPNPWNPGPRGLDPPLEVNQSALDNIKKRKDNNKLCNNHYLRGPCAKGDACCFEHKYRPTEAEKTAIAFLARLNPCTNGQDCDVGDCIYGHHCPSTRDGQCMHPYCKFKTWEHPPGTKFRPTYQYSDDE